MVLTRLIQASSYRQNVIKTTIVHGDKRTTSVGACILPSENYLEALGHLDQALHNVRMEKLILLGAFDVNMKNPQDQRQREIHETIEFYKIQDLAQKFVCPRQ